MKRSFIYLFILLLVGTAGTAFAQGEIYGTVLDENGAPFGGVFVKVTQGGLLKGGTASEDDGTYSVKPLQPGNYDIEFSSQGYAKIIVTDITVSTGGTVKLNRKMQIDGGTQLKGTVIYAKYKDPLINKTDVISSKTIERAPTRNINDLVALQPGVYQSSRGGGVSIGGDRSDGTVYILDGQMISSTAGGITPAQGTTAQVQVFSSGVPANYGDATGGIVAITSKGVSNKLHGTIQAQHSIDGYNQNLINASATGPIISKKLEGGAKETILGFLAGVDYQYDQDANPTFIKNPVLKGDKLKQLQDNPLTLVNTTSGSVLLPSSRFVTKDDFNFQKQQLNNSAKTVRFNGKLDYAVNKNINITAGGSFSYQDAQGYNRNSSYFAPDAIPHQISTVGRGYLRFRQSFGSTVEKQLNEYGKDTSKRPVISNAYYTIQVDYSTSTASSEDPNFKHNLFDYGYVGKFTQSRVPTYAFGKDSASGRSAVILQTLDAVNGITFQPSKLNPVLANYTQSVYNTFGNTGLLSNSVAVQGLGGMMNGDFPLEALRVQNANISNIGAGLTGFGYSFSNQAGLHADASFDFKPRNSKTVHAIQFGLYYEQRSSGQYNAYVNTTGAGNTSIWSLMSQLVNRHILGLDYDNPRFIHNGVEYSKGFVDSNSFFLPTDTIIYNRKNTGNQSVFDANLRKEMGYGANQFIDMHSIDPSKLSVKMFSADEILNQGAGFVSYNGYDYTGKKLTGQVNFNDFFTAKDAAGNLSRPLAAFQPNYIAGYIMDAFRFKDMNFNVGVRIERYDANTKVLKDPYSLYELNSKGNTNAAMNTANGGKHPDNIGDNYAVYVDNNQSLSPHIVGYRNGDKWYDPFGTQIPDPTALKNGQYGTGGTDPVPYLTTAGKTNISDAGFDPNKSFTDYKPQVNIAPRFQFNFPVSGDKALFYAHYDILVQRPKVGNYANPLDYMYLDRNQGNVIGNPDLKPQRTIDYEFGFQQELTSNSALKIYAFYKERKDMIQIRPYLYAWPKTYYTYGNRDFSTTKGFAFKYDYRKPQNASIPIEMTLAYTLQFADGTGSNAASSNGGSGTLVASSGLMQNFISSGLPNLRFVTPLNYDSRHNINLNFNYGYDNNEGPTINGVKVLQNFNANLIMRARSGEPYTTYANVNGNNIQGGLNGTRLPWHFGIDLRLDKSFALKGGHKKGIEGQNEKPRYFINAFAYFQNIFNIREILSVWAYTSRPDDDGYITSPLGQQYLSALQTPAQSSYDLYSMYVNNPYNYNGPRRATIGCSFVF